MDSRVVFAQAGQPVGQGLQRGPVRYGDGEVVEAGRSGRPCGIQAEAEVGAAAWVGQEHPHELAALHELQLEPVAEPGLVPRAGSAEVGHGKLEVVHPGQDRHTVGGVASCFVWYGPVQRVIMSHVSSSPPLLQSHCNSMCS
jgi:hypothetical protein